MKKAFIYVEILVSLVIFSFAIGIIGIGVATAVKSYKTLKEKYLAMLTAENVLHALAADVKVPERMNGFDVDYHWEGEKLIVRVGRWTFEYEVKNE